jgi:multiple sugar transport system permease protein
MINQANLAQTVVETPRVNYYKIRAQVIAYLFLMPALLIFALVSWYPIVLTVINSFQQIKLTGDSTWVGGQNYVRMFKDPVFYASWENIGVFILLSIVMGFMVPVICAIIVNEMRGPIAAFIRSLVYVPTLIPIAIALIVWRQIYAPEGGILNSMLEMVGVSGQLWLQNPVLVKPAIVVIMTWLGAGSTILIYLAALQEIPTDIYEAAELDGFSIWHRVWFIALPLIRSRMWIMLVLQVIAMSQLFDPAYILTQGGPANASVTPVLTLFRTAFERSDYGLAAAWSVSMIVATSVFSALYVWLTRRNENRDTAR